MSKWSVTTTKEQRQVGLIGTTEVERMKRKFSLEFFAWDNNRRALNACVPRFCWQYSMNWTEIISHIHTLVLHGFIEHWYLVNAPVRMNYSDASVMVTFPSSLKSIVCQQRVMVILIFKSINPKLAHLIPQQHFPEVATSRWYHLQWCPTWFLNAGPGTTYWAFNTMPLSTGRNPTEARGNMSLCHTENVPFIKYGLRC